MVYLVLMLLMLSQLYWSRHAFWFDLCPNFDFDLGSDPFNGTIMVFRVLDNSAKGRLGVTGGRSGVRSAAKIPLILSRPSESSLNAVSSLAF